MSSRPPASTARSARYWYPGSAEPGRRIPGWTTRWSTWRCTARPRPRRTPSPSSPAPWCSSSGERCTARRPSWTSSRRTARAGCPTTGTQPPTAMSRPPGWWSARPDRRLRTHSRRGAPAPPGAPRIVRTHPQHVMSHSHQGAVMAGTNAKEIRVAGSGRVLIAPLATAPPADTSAAWGAAWKDLGYTSTDGVKITKKDKLDPVDTWQSVSAARFVYSDRDLSFKFQLLQLNEDTMPFFFGGGSVKETATGSGLYKYELEAEPK